MSEGRALVHPMAIAFAARTVDVPGLGNQLCCSAFFPFQLEDGKALKPADFYEAVASHSGPEAIADPMQPLVNAEAMMLGTAPPVVQDRREAFLQVGPIEVEMLLAPEAGNRDSPIPVGPESASWHAQENPDGRGGPEDDRRPLILNKERMETPLWLGNTPFEHALRQGWVGEAADPPTAGWPPSTDQKVFNEAHPRLWTESLHPGAPIVLDGLTERRLESRLPNYQVEMAYTEADGEWHLLTCRINSVVLIPAAEMGAVIWRGSIPLGKDQFGENIIAAVAAMQDFGEKKDVDHWAAIAAERWADPVRAADDRELVPADMAKALPPLFSVPEGMDTVTPRREAAEEWMRNEAGLPEENPFADQAPPETKAIEQMEEVAEQEDPPDLAQVDEIAKGALAASRRSHEQAGFETPEVELTRKPEWRGDSLDAEIRNRLSGPYRSKMELEMAHFLRTAESPQKPEEVMANLTEARIINPMPSLPWPAMGESEGVKFGEAIKEKLDEGDVERHLDISAAIFSEGIIVADRTFKEVLLEESVWRNSQFVKCEFDNSTLAGARFENCQFVDCVFRKTNLSRIHIEGCKFMRCELRDCMPSDMVWMENSFEACTLEKVDFQNLVMRDIEFAGGTWKELQFSDGLSVNLSLREMSMEQVTLTAFHAPYTSFRRVRMFKVFAMARGFPGGLFEEVDAETCGFLGIFHFNESKFIKSGFREVGFTNAVFKDGQIAGGCKFEMCDFTGAIFDNFNISGVRFPECGFVTSIWMNKCQALQTSFFACLLRAVDFGDTMLTGAVFVDADIDDMEALPDATIGADFTGTVRAL